MNTSYVITMFRAAGTVTGIMSAAVFRTEKKDKSAFSIVTNEIEGRSANENTQKKYFFHFADPVSGCRGNLAICNNADREKQVLRNQRLC